MTSVSTKRNKFTYAHTTEFGTVLINENDAGWWHIFFEERWSSDQAKELLGTFPTVQDAINAARSGLVDAPEQGVELIDMNLPDHPNCWLHHHNGFAA